MRICTECAGHVKAKLPVSRRKAKEILSNLRPKPAMHVIELARCLRRFVHGSFLWRGTDGNCFGVTLHEARSDPSLMLCRYSLMPSHSFQGPDGTAPTWAYSAGAQHRNFLSLRFEGAPLDGDSSGLALPSKVRTAFGHFRVDFRGSV